MPFLNLTEILKIKYPSPEPANLRRLSNRMKAFWTFLALLILADQTVAARVSRTRRELAPGLHQWGIQDAGGSYCERRDACCPDRNDECTVPYIGTLCYCDVFCNRTVSDCCPDFWKYCLGIDPPFGAHRGGLWQEGVATWCVDIYVFVTVVA